MGATLCVVGAAMCVVGAASSLTSCNVCSLEGLIRVTKERGLLRSMKQPLTLALESALCR